MRFYSSCGEELFLVSFDPSLPWTVRGDEDEQNEDASNAKRLQPMSSSQHLPLEESYIVIMSSYSRIFCLTFSHTRNDNTTIPFNFLKASSCLHRIVTTTNISIHLSVIAIVHVVVGTALFKGLKIQRLKLIVSSIHLSVIAVDIVHAVVGVELRRWLITQGLRLIFYPPRVEDTAVEIDNSIHLSVTTINIVRMRLWSSRCLILQQDTSKDHSCWNSDNSIHLSVTTINIVHVLIGVQLPRRLKIQRMRS
ncbi:hypothetical protein Y032_0563g3522 [Ancylostoma ceylanicum]|uniref:Uncharacterized protein n=1 Tax=Ancylostoma ceylanicum TaxID=53326 RepID=A0A016WRH8_9BILA|nr:hypothetical protein Y032_0563g3522 [Ancylostoma ceylanicum]